MAYELLARDYKYRGRVFDISVSRFQSAQKGEVSIELVHHNGGSGAIPLFEDGSIALVRQWRYPMNRLSLEICAGRIEPGQSPEETAFRELEEEMGLKASELKELSRFSVAPGYCEERISVYLATGIEETSQNLDDDEEIEVVRMSYQEAMGMVGSGDIDDAKSI
ncbi:MAG: NUDIX hydrolase, partial [Blastocatellia bacterium]